MTMHRIALALILAAVTASPAFAQGRGKNKQKVPPGHLPPAGLCRVWYDGVPPGRQPAPTNCYEAQRIAARDRGARVLSGGGRGRNDGPIYRDGRQSDRPIYRDGRQFPDDRRGDERRGPDADGRRPNPTGARSGGRAVPRGDDRYGNGQ